LFSPDEWDNLVSGEDVFDWELLQRNALFTEGCAAESQAVQWFWDIFDHFSLDHKRKFLQAATGSDRVPLGGLSEVKMTFIRQSDPANLPKAHTCFSRLTLPDYPTKEEMRRKLILAITETEGFGFR
jgi:hypothetical protein